MSAPPSTDMKPMQYVRLGKSGLKVSRIILGCMSYGDPKWESWILDEKTSIEHIRRAYNRGINTFDWQTFHQLAGFDLTEADGSTANMYSNGASEVVLGKALKEIGMPRENVVVLTKCYFPLHRNDRGRNQNAGDSVDYINQQGLSRKNIFASVKASLERLDLEYIDLLQCHRFDYETPIEETMQALHDVVQAGLVRYVGMSSCHAYQFHQMQNYAITNRLTPFISMQNFYNAAYREEEREMIPTLNLFGVGMIPWSPLSRGFLTRPHNKSSARQESDGMFKDRNPAMTEDDARIAINERIEEVAKKRGSSMAQVALAWCLANKTVTAPIIGTTRLEALNELCDAIHLELTDEEKSYIDTPYTPRQIIGHK